MDGRSVVTKALVIQFSCQQECSRRDRGGRPPKPTYGSPRLALIPTELALKVSEIDELGFHLDHEQNPCLGMEGQHVDPSRMSGSPHLDFSLHHPAVSGKPTYDVRDAAGVGCIALSGARNQHRCFDPEHERCTECMTDCFRLGDRESVNTATFHEG